MLSDELNELVCLAVAANPSQAYLWQKAIEKEGIRCEVFGDYLDVGVAISPRLSPEVWVENWDRDRAEMILRHYRDHSEEVAHIG